MTAPRHRQRRFGGRGLRAAAVALALLMPGAAALAATTELIVVDQNNGLAIYGFDPVAYFTEKAPKTGRSDLEYTHAGVPWRFRSEGNRAAFIGNPEVYMPQFGGYDPTDLARGVPQAGDPQLWLLRGERLYFFYTEAARERFADDAERILTAAGREWPAVQRNLSP